MRQGLLQKLDQEQAAGAADFDPNYLNLSFDPNNEYTIPYQAGTDAIVYNSDKVKDAPKSYADLWKPDYRRGSMVVAGRFARRHRRDAADAGLRCQHDRREAVGRGQGQVGRTGQGHQVV